MSIKFNLGDGTIERGSLASLSKENEEKLKALRPEEGIPAWAFRFLQAVPGVTMVLSGHVQP